MSIKSSILQMRWKWNSKLSSCFLNLWLTCIKHVLLPKTNLLKQAKMKTNNKQTKVWRNLGSSMQVCIWSAKFWKTKETWWWNSKIYYYFLNIWKFPGHYIEDEQRVLTNFFFLSHWNGKDKLLAGMVTKAMGTWDTNLGKKRVRN